MTKQKNALLLKGMKANEIKERLQTVTISPDEVEDKELSQALSTLLQLVELLFQDNEKLKAENQKLRDENNLLKGEQGKPDIKGNTKKADDISSEKERKEKKEKKKRLKPRKPDIKIDRTEECKVDRSLLPEDAVFKGYDTVVVQEILITTNNVEYKKEVFYSASENKTYMGELPRAIALKNQLKQ